ncbi:hypothetical protein Y032_0015g2617 [Ancylostoma ceylanicum]|uniref:Uncharacterized protein n=1 Tax=Ancylostoma ceylanicum TaxID=53326 RepID=A0A016V8M5_9BILA|nr:hypothetical protein Y032_0015g2617 [Ancylostoma ceylanicum]
MMQQWRAASNYGAPRPSGSRNLHSGPFRKRNFVTFRRLEIHFWNQSGEKIKVLLVCPTSKTMLDTASTGVADSKMATLASMFIVWQPTKRRTTHLESEDLRVLPLYASTIGGRFFRLYFFHNRW